MEKEFDAFISHSSNDKMYFVRPLANSLLEYGAKLWYDEFSLKAGTSLSRSIEKGLSNSKYGIVILSKSFFEKRWTEYELRALNSFEIENPEVIIPVWYKVNESDVRQFSPYLADKLAIVFTDKSTIDEISIQILEVIREDIFEQIHQKKAWQELIAKAEVKVLEKGEYSKLKIGPILHKELPINLVIRIRLIRSVLFEVYPHSMQYWMEGFQRDAHPDDEIYYWEKIATMYKESIDVLKITSIDKKKEILSLILGRTSGLKIEDINLTKLYPRDISAIELIISYPIPPFDIKDKKFGQ